MLGAQYGKAYGELVLALMRWWYLRCSQLLLFGREGIQAVGYKLKTTENIQNPSVSSLRCDRNFEVGTVSAFLFKMKCGLTSTHINIGTIWYPRQRFWQKEDPVWDSYQDSRLLVGSTDSSSHNITRNELSMVREIQKTFVKWDQHKNWGKQELARGLSRRCMRVYRFLRAPRHPKEKYYAEQDFNLESNLLNRNMDVRQFPGIGGMGDDQGHWQCPRSHAMAQIKFCPQDKLSFASIRRLLRHPAHACHALSLSSL
jgi:hypothetical protein